MTKKQTAYLILITLCVTYLMKIFPVDQSLVDKAKTFAQHYHTWQLYGDGNDYFLAHLVPVAQKAMELAKPLHLDLFAVEIFAYLHDVLEDCEQVFWMEYFYFPIVLHRSQILPKLQMNIFQLLVQQDRRWKLSKLLIGISITPDWLIIWMKKKEENFLIDTSNK